MEKNFKSSIDIPQLVQEDFFELAGLKNLKEEEKRHFIQKLLESVRSKVMIRLVDALTNKDKVLFYRLLDEGNDGEITRFLESRGLEINKLVVEESLLAKKRVLKLLADLRK